jgi:hypothetical protein
LFGLIFVSYLSGIALAQGKAGSHAPDSAHGIDHDRDADHNKTHGTADTHEDSKGGNFLARIERNPELSQKLQALLPKSGPNSKLAGAAMGFKTEGQFIAALHAAKELGIPFDQLKMEIMSTNPPMKLGQAIHALKPNLTEKEIDKVTDKAEKEAKEDEKTKSTTKPTT